MSNYIQKVAIYCRLSKEDREKQIKSDDSESIQNQKLLLMEYAIQQNWQIYKVYVDEDYSGLDRNRPQFNLMIEDAEAKKFDIILCKNQSRFSRDMEQIEKYLHNDFLLWGIRFVGVVDHADTEKKEGKKARQINGLVNEWYCEGISEDVKASLESKKRNGQYLGYWCTYGYELNPKDKHKLVVDPEAASVVKEIYSLYLQGYGINSISKILTEKNYLTPCNYKCQKGKKYFNPSAKYSKDYNVWAKNTVRRILRDKTYLGYLIQGRQKKISYKSKKMIEVPEKDWIIVENNHEPIIDEDTFNKVQSRIKTKSSCFKCSDGKMPKMHIFAGKVKCMKCKGSMHKNHGKNNVLYLRCGLAVKTKSKCCTLHTIRLDNLIESVTESIRNLLQIYISNKENKQELLSLYLKSQDLEEELKKQNIILSNLKRKQEEVARGLSNIYLDKVKEIISEQNFQILQNNFGNQIENLEKQKLETQQKIEILKSKLSKKNISELKIEKYINFKELTHEMVNDFIDFIEIGEKDSNGNQEIKIFWRF